MMHKRKRDLASNLPVPPAQTQNISPPESNEEARGQDDDRGGDAHGARRPQSRPSRHRGRRRCKLFRRARGKGPGRPGGTTGFAKPSMHALIFHSRLSYLPLAPTAPLCKLRGSGEGTTKDECGAAQQTQRNPVAHKKTSSIPRLRWPIGRHRRLPPEGRAPAPRRHHGRAR